MFHRYDERARDTLFYAREEASDWGRGAIELEHLLVGLTRDASGVPARVFASAHLSPDDVRAEVQGRFPARDPLPASLEMPFSREVVHVLEVAAAESERLKHRHIGSEHLLLAFLADTGSFAGRLLRERGIREDIVRAHIGEPPESSDAS